MRKYRRSHLRVKLCCPFCGVELTHRNRLDFTLAISARLASGGIATKRSRAVSTCGNCVARFENMGRIQAWVEHGQGEPDVIFDTRWSKA